MVILNLHTCICCVLLEKGLEGESGGLCPNLSWGLGPSPLIGLQDRTKDGKLWSLIAATFPDFESEQGRHSASLSSQAWPEPPSLLQGRDREPRPQDLQLQRALRTGFIVSLLKDLVRASEWGLEQFSCLFLNLFGLAVLGGAGFNSSPSLALSYRSWMTRHGTIVCPSADKISLGRSAEPQLLKRNGT